MEPRPDKGITGRPRAIFAVSVVVLAVIGLKLWTLQIVKAKKYRAMGQSNIVRRIDVKPERGAIYDRHGVELARSRIRFDACVDYGRIMGNAVVRKGVVDTLSVVLKLPRDAIEKRLEPRRVIPYRKTRIKRDITQEEFLQLKILAPERPGLWPVVEVARDYPQNDLAAHILGYTGAISAEDVKEYREKGYSRDDIIGITGVEYVCEKDLQGERGELVVGVDNRGRRVSVIDSSKGPVRGGDVYLSIDLALQRAASEALGDQAGAVVIVDPRNGDVLALVSRPAFDPNIFTTPRSEEDVAEIKRIFNDVEAKPLLNRAISRPYPLGSAFKVVTALAALGHEERDKGLTSETVYTCRGSFHLGRWRWRCYHGHSHGEMKVVSAIMKSCNVFFYNVGYRAGRDALVNMAEKLGLGKKTGIELSAERPGVNPTREWLGSSDRRVSAYTPWVPGLTVNLSIGQYPIEVTPIQVAMMYSAIATGGTLYKPRIVKRIVRGGEETFFEPEGTDLGIPEENIALVREGLALVTQRGGTAQRSFRKLQYLKAAGKTSTAEPGRDLDWAHTWFIAFAPHEAPEILVVVLVEKGKTGGTTSAPIAAEILERWFEERTKRNMLKTIRMLCGGSASPGIWSD